MLILKRKHNLNGKHIDRNQLKENHKFSCEKLKMPSRGESAMVQRETKLS